MNDRLYDVCTHVTTPDDGYRVIEGEGSGIYTAQEAVRQAGLKPIQFIDRVIRFTAMISREPLVGARAADVGSPKQKSEAGPRQSSPTVPSSRQEAVLLALRSLRHPAGIDDIMGALPGPFAELRKPQVRYVLTKLLQEGVIVREGGRGNRNTTYRLA